MCPHCRAFITTDDKICPYCNTEVAPRAYRPAPPSDALGGLIPQARFATVVLMLINTGLYVLTLLRSGGLEASDGAFQQALIDLGAKFVPDIIFHNEWWRIVTAGFLHGGTLHILMNMWVLFDLGAQVDEMFGTARFLVIYLFSNITGFLASMYLLPRSLSVGASAAIFGLIGAMIALGVRERHSAIRSFYVRWAIYGLVMSFLPGFAADWAAHIGGLAGGFLIGLIAGLPTRVTLTERIWQIASGVMLAITGLSFFDMAMHVLAGR